MAFFVRDDLLVGKLKNKGRLFWKNSLIGKSTVFKTVVVGSSPSSSVVL